MAELRGTPVIYNADNISVGAIIVAAKAKVLSNDFGREADFNGFNDDVGDIMSEVTTNKRKTLSIRCVPYDASLRATAVTNMYAMLPAPGSAVVIADDEGVGTVIEADNSANYSVRSAKLGRTSEGIATVDLELMEYEHVDITVAVT